VNLYGFAQNRPLDWVDVLGYQGAASAEECIPLAPLVGISPALLTRLGLAGVLVGEVIYICKTACEIPGAYEEMKRQQQLAKEAEERAQEAERQLEELKRRVEKELINPSLPLEGEPGTTVGDRGQTRRYGEDGYPEVDRDFPHGGGKPIEREDHAHDWGRPEGGGKPTKEDRGPARHPKPGDPPAPPGYNN
jgi:hypothetical protein